jgi:hypothetical protein
MYSIRAYNVAKGKTRHKESTMEKRITLMAVISILSFPVWSGWRRG